MALPPRGWLDDLIYFIFIFLNFLSGLKHNLWIMVLGDLIFWIRAVWAASTLPPSLSVCLWVGKPRRSYLQLGILIRWVSWMGSFVVENIDEPCLILTNVEVSKAPWILTFRIIFAGVPLFFVMLRLFSWLLLKFGPAFLSFPEFLVTIG